MILKKIDSYIFGKYIKTFLFTVLIFTLISFIVDFSEKVQEFIKKPSTAHQIIFDYYANFILFINGILFPLYALIAVIFFTSRMASNSEIISILNAGVSFRRLLFPYMLAATLIATFHLWANHILIPKGNETRINFENQYVNTDKVKVIEKNIHMFLTPQDKLFAKIYKKQDSSLVDLRLEHFEDNKLTRILTTKRAKYLDSLNLWRINSYEQRTFKGMNETLIRHKGKPIDTTLNVTPQDFIRFESQKEMMTTPKLLKYIEQENQRGFANLITHRIEVYRRSADPFTIIILTIIGVSVAARKVRGGIGLHLAVGIGLGALFILMSRFSQTFAMSDAIPPLIGVWLPNILFSIVAIFLVAKAQK